MSFGINLHRKLPLVVNLVSGDVMFVSLTKIFFVFYVSFSQLINVFVNDL